MKIYLPFILIMQNSQYLFDVYCVPSPLIYFFILKKKKQTKIQSG